MELVAKKSQLRSSVRIPGSKSHMVRALVIAALADGESEIFAPLDSGDTTSCVAACRALGATIEPGESWKVRGTGGVIVPPDNVIDVGNSGTSLYVTVSTAALGEGYSVFTGDEQIRRRPAQPLLDALTALGAEAYSTRGNGMAPLVIRGPLRGGRVALHCPTSQYLSSLLLNSPLAQGDTAIEVLSLNEQPYVHMTLSWLDEQQIEYRRDELQSFTIRGGQRYRAFSKSIPGDFSSATFFLCAAAITGSDLTLLGLDLDDSQGDKAVVDMLQSMGVRIEASADAIRVQGGDLVGAELDLNATPDALPALAVTACMARGETRLLNVPQARLKETDRLSVMNQVLTAMGAQVQELEDGLIIQGGRLRGARVPGHGDHRVVMALAIAGLAAEGETVVDTAEAVSVTFPNFVELMTSAGADLHLRDEGA